MNSHSLIIEQLSNNLRSILSKHTPELFRRNRKLSIFQIFDAISYQIQNKNYINTTTYLLDICGVNITEASLIYRRKQLNENVFNNIYDSLFEKYKNILTSKRNGDYTLQMVDGSNITLLPTFKKYGFSKHSNSENTHGLLTGIYNQTDDNLTSFSFDKKYNERDMFTNAMEYINLNSKRNVFVFDRGYWQPTIANNLLNNNHDFVFRLNKINRHLDILKNTDTRDYIGYFEIKDENRVKHKIPIRYIRYDVGDSKFFIATSLVHLSIEEISEIYKKRWSVEIVYKLLKEICDLSLTKHKIDLFYSQNLLMFRIIYLIHKIIYNSFQKIEKKVYDKKTKYNYSNGINTMINCIMGKLLHRPINYIKNIIGLVHKMLSHYIISDSGRNFPRRALSMQSRWYLLGKLTKNPRYPDKSS